MSLEILRKYQIKAKKALGQNFLVNEKIVEDIASAINTENKNIIEVGPGYGALTEKLLEKNINSLNLVELDIDMIEILEDRIKEGTLDIENKNFKINNIDVLKYEPKDKNYSVIANIPYYITSPILRHFLYETEYKPEYMVILMQDDVGLKIIDNKKSSVLSLFIAKKSDVSEYIKVPKENFIPAPKIESSVLLFKSHDKYNNIDDKIFLDLIKKAFSSPRKKMLKNLIQAGYDKKYLENICDKIGIDYNARAENLNIDKWIEFIKNM